MNKPSTNAKEEAGMLVKTIINKMDSINSLMLGHAEISYDEINDCNYIHGNKELIFLLEGNLPKYKSTISDNIEILLQFADTIDNTNLLEDAKRVLTEMDSLMEFIAGEYNNNPELPLTNIVSLLKTVQAKIKLHTEKSIGVGDVAQLAQITTMGVIQAIKRNQLKAIKKGNTWFIDSEDAMKWLIKRA